MSDEIKTPRTDSKSFAIGWIHDTSKIVVDVEDCRELEKELIVAQARIRELEAASWQRTPVEAHRTCSGCHQLLPAPLFPDLAGNETICCRCYWPCGDIKT